MRHIPRFYCPDTVLQQNAAVILPDLASHHARVVLRLRDGETIKLFNARDGEWQGPCHLPDKKTVSVTLTDQLKTTETLRDVWLVLAPLKNKDAFDNAIRHAVELGVARIILAQTDRTQQSKINADRLRQQIIDAAQQCGRLSVPDCDPPQPLKKLLATWPTERRLLACVEGENASPPLSAMAHDQAGIPLAILVGPEGGFSDAEKLLLTNGQLAWLKPVSLGPLILRSDTAVAASLSICILNI